MERKFFVQKTAVNDNGNNIANLLAKMQTLCLYGHQLTRYRYQRERLLSNVGFHCIPFCENTLELMKETFVWRNLIKEILLSECYTIQQIAAECNVSLDLLKNFIQQQRAIQKMPDLAGTKILEIHTKVCPEHNPPGLKAEQLNS